MVIVAVVGLLVSFLQPSLLWLFLTISAVAVGGIFPTLMLIFGKALQPWSVTASVWFSLLISLPTAVLGNIWQVPDLQIMGTLVSLMLSLTLCCVGRVRN